LNDTAKAVKNEVKKVVSVPVAIAERKPDRLDLAVEKMKAEVVAKLKDGESRGINFKEGEMKPTFDPPQSLKASCGKIGGTMKSECLSWGAYQAKSGTIQLWAKQLDGTELTEKQAIELALDTERMTEFVTRVIFSLKGSIWNWSYATANRTWFDDKISTIRTLEEIK
jgi:hypothetical protein